MNPESKARLFNFRVQENERVADGIFRLLLAAPYELVSALRPGMFLNLAVPGNPAHLTRVPLSFAGADAEAGTVEIVYAAVGDATRRLSLMRPGQESTVVGPLGNGWWLPQSRQRAIVVAGGVGLPPVVAAARMLREAGVEVTAVVGAQTEGKLWQGGLDALDAMGVEVYVATDDGTRGYHGFTTGVVRDLLSVGEFGSILTCGPTPMMAGVARLAEGAGVHCQASLERMMTCGFGACNTCNVAMRAGGYKSCCMDGPVFDAGEVAW